MRFHVRATARATFEVGEDPTGLLAEFLNLLFENVQNAPLAPFVGENPAGFRMGEYLGAYLASDGSWVIWRERAPGRNEERRLGIDELRELVGAASEASSIV